MKTTTILSLLATALFVTCLVGCGGNTAPTTSQPSDFDRLMKWIEENEKKVAALAAEDREKLAEAIAKMSAAPRIGNADFDSRTISAGVTGLQLPSLKEGEVERNVVHVQGKDAVKAFEAVMKSREVCAYICVVPPTLLPQPAPVFIPPQPQQHMLPVVPPVVPVQPPVGRP